MSIEDRVAGPAAGLDLKPCPFCGREPYVITPDFPGAEYQIGCFCGDDEGREGDNWDPEMGACWRDGKTLEEATRRWNRRAANRED